MGVLPEELGQIRMGQGQHSRLERKWTVQQWDPKQVPPLLSHGLLTVGLTIPPPRGVVTHQTLTLHVSSETQPSVRFSECQPSSS